ncbi:unnamed protein product [Paramecium octaurelia]|uniref:Uncharacterized protein n=1 Tax=Paramecium octaurelia TaxID=43137 RepID=A0A8S1W1M0_PAROT|nr:unnamed protein product [Paramecium octaurelia]
MIFYDEQKVREIRREENQKVKTLKPSILQLLQSYGMDTTHQLEAICELGEILRQFALVIFIHLIGNIHFNWFYKPLLQGKNFKARFREQSQDNFCSIIPKTQHEGLKILLAQLYDQKEYLKYCISYRDTNINLTKGKLINEFRKILTFLMKSIVSNTNLVFQML